MQSYRIYIWTALKVIYLIIIITSIVTKGGKLGMNWEIKRELIEIAIGLASALGGFIIALLHNYRKRLEESKQ